MRTTRRAFVGALAAAPLGLASGARTELTAMASAAVRTEPAAPAIRRTSQSGRSGTTALRVDAQALRTRIEALSAFGRPAGGAFADGVSRVAYSDADIAGRAYVMDLMRAAALEPRIDPAGNIFGRRAGLEPVLPPILFGSHIDSVPNGGNFDGDLGSLAALAVVEACARADVRTRHPLDIVVWSAEEGVAFGRGLAGSRIVAGDLAPADLAQVWNGLSRADAIRRIGGDPDRIREAVRSKGAHHCYLELHIEQGGTLERGRATVGVVEGIVSIQRPRRPDDGSAGPDGHDLRAQHRRHQPLAEGTDLLGGLRPRRQRPPADRARDGPRVEGFW